MKNYNPLTSKIRKRTSDVWLRQDNNWDNTYARKGFNSGKNTISLGGKRDLVKLDSEEIDDTTPSQDCSQQSVTQKQTTLDSWLISERSQRFKRRRKK